jgi:uncharacterized small protein (DUF1192 family)
MSSSVVSEILREIEGLLALAGDLPAEAELAVEKLLNVVEALSSDRQSLVNEVQRLKAQLEQKKRGKNTGKGSKPTSDHSSEKKRRERSKSKRPSSGDRRSFKDLTIHETIECPVDPQDLPPDAVRVEDEEVIVQDIKIKPHNIRFLRSVHYSSKQKKYFLGPLPSGYDTGDFGADLRALILSLKYCGNMSEPKIGELLENFDVQISAGSLSNILTKTADSFAGEFDDIVSAGLASTPYQQTDDTSARVNGEFWHTHILCNPYYAAYFTRPHKDRLTVLEILQNTDDLGFRFGQETLELLQTQFHLPQKWQRTIEAIGETTFEKTSLATLLDSWFGQGNRQLRTAIKQAAAIVYYRHQTSVPIVETIVCDDAGQFKLLTERLALCWIHSGRHYEKLSPVVPRHVKLLDAFLNRYWDYYQSLKHYRDGPTDEQAALLRLEFDELFSTRTGYEALDERIAKTAAKKEELLTVLSVPEVPLHNNASELQARVSARRRDVSLHSRSVRGARAMDIFTTIVQTAKLQGISAYAYLRDRIKRHCEITSLAKNVQNAAASG